MIVIESFVELKKRAVSVDDIIFTLGYFNNGDGGNSTYLITESSIYSDFRSQKLNNNLWANDISGSDNVLVYGVDKNGTNACDSLVSQITQVIGSAFFPSGTYKFSANVFNPKNWKTNNVHFIFENGRGFYITDVEQDFTFLSGNEITSSGNCLTINYPWTALVRPTTAIMNAVFNGGVYINGAREMTFNSCTILGGKDKTCLQLQDTINISVTNCMISSQTNDEVARYGLLLTKNIHQNEGLTLANSIIINVKNGYVSDQSLQSTISNSIIDQCHEYALNVTNQYSFTVDNSYLMTRSNVYPAVYLLSKNNTWDNVISNTRIVGSKGIKIFSEEGVYSTRNVFSMLAFENVSDYEIDATRMGQSIIDRSVFDRKIIDVIGGGNIYTLNTFNAGFVSAVSSPATFVNNVGI